ncbi:hypothetical protein [Nocardia cyriacigeorgica]|uniref:hypothetical protein n=1 Tax=Nocardia cyriacigeorgica TaxID=135487 RepID=UPI0014873784|nr:hypothetical protein [Nocardia cyriacigeorgica]
MKKYVIALGAAAMMLSGCGDDGNASSDTTTTTAPASATTTAMPPISTAQEAQPYATAVDQRIAPCLENGAAGAASFTPQCALAITSTVAALNEWDGRLHSGAPSARKAIQTKVADLEYWRDYCISSQANSPQRLACMKFLITNDISTSIMFGFSEDANRGR